MKRAEKGGSHTRQAQNIALSAVHALGSGFDVTTDFRLQGCKRTPPLIELDKNFTQTLAVPGLFSIPNVSKDVKCDKGEHTRLASDVMEFQQMSELFNQNACVEGKVPLGFFNSSFDFSGSWQTDAAKTKNLALYGSFITLYTLQLTRAPLILREEVKQAVPSTWEPAGLARFIEKYGTHIVISVSIGGQDVLYLKQNQSSSMSSSDICSFLTNLGDQYLREGSSQKTIISKLNATNEKLSQSYTFISQPAHMQIAQLHSGRLLFGNKELTVTSKRRGGDLWATTHKDWQATVKSTPDVISMSFIPITSLLPGVPGKGFLNHAINLYLRYKPPLEEIQHFLDFQVPKQWAPVYSELTLGPPRKQATSPSLRFSLMGPKLYVNTTQVCVGKVPVTGVRLFLEGRRHNILSIHLQHLSSLPQVLQTYWGLDVQIEPPRWHGSNDEDSKWFEPVRWRSFSHVCIKPVKFCPEWLDSEGGVFVVTGAQLEKRRYGLKSVLHLKLQFTRLLGCTLQKSSWDQPTSTSQKSGFFSALSTTFINQNKNTKEPKPVVLNSAVLSSAPPKPSQIPKLLKFVDTKESSKGPQDIPGHWLVTAAQLELDRKKICLRVKYSLINY